LHRRLDNALAQVEDAFRRTTLAEVLGDLSDLGDSADPSAPKPLCEIGTKRP
jgi:hypothetical protein